ncbi:tetratricopeptide repeat protein [Longispora urticae]
MDALELRKAAEAGDAEAMVALADLIGGEDPEDPEALDWYGRAAAAGSIEGMYAFGVVLRCEGDEEQAEPWLRRAAATGHTDAMVEIGHIFDHLDEREQAMEWYQRAADAGNADGASNLAALATLQHPRPAVPRDSGDPPAS